MVQALARWQHPVAPSEALDVLYREMRPALYRHICMAIKIASDLSAYFAVVESAMMAIGLPLRLDKGCSSIKCKRLPLGRVCCCYSLPYSRCTIVHRNYQVCMTEWLDGHLGSSRSRVETLLE